MRWSGPSPVPTPGVAVRALAALALLAACPPAEEEVPPPEPIPAFEPLGPWAVGHQSRELVDADRGDRALPVELWFPVAPADAEGLPAAEYPLGAGFSLPSEVAVDFAPVAEVGQWLLVFSHGYRGINTQSVELMESLASYGFVVASPEHVGNSQAAPDDDFDTAASNRVPDVSFVLDALQEASTDPDDILFERIGEAEVGVLGHSFGGMTSIGSAAGWAGAAADPRVAAIAPISAVIDGDLQEDDRTGDNAGFTPEQLATITVPTLLLGGTADVSVPIGNNHLAFDEITNAPFVASVEIDGANHTHFANVCAIGDFLIELGFEMSTWDALGAGELTEPYESTCTGDAFPIDEAIRLTQAVVVPFFLNQLLGDEDFAPWVSERYGDQEPALAVSVRGE